MHLELTQPIDRTEDVTYDIIDKLYNLAYENQVLGINSKLDGTSNVAGSIRADKAYKDAVYYVAGYVNSTLNNNGLFPNLRVTVANGFYVRFDDSYFEAAIRNLPLGDSVGVTDTDLAGLLSINSLCRNNLSVNLTDLRFLTYPGLDCTNVLYHNRDDITSQVAIGSWNNPAVVQTVDIKCSGFTIYINGNGGGHFIGVSDGRYKVQINSLDWNGSTLTVNTSVGAYDQEVFKNCIFIEHVGTDINWFMSLIPNQTLIPAMFRGCQLSKIIYREGITDVDGSYPACNVSYLEYPSTITSVGTFMNGYREGAIGVNSGTGFVVIKATTPPTTYNTSVASSSKLPQYIFVPDSAVTTYKTANYGLWPSLTSLILPISAMTDELANMGTIGSSNKYSY